MMRADKPKAKLTQRIDSGGKKFTVNTVVCRIYVYFLNFCVCVWGFVYVCAPEKCFVVNPPRGKCNTTTLLSSPHSITLNLTHWGHGKKKSSSFYC